MNMTSAFPGLDARTSVLELLDAFHRTTQQQLETILNLVRDIHRKGSASNAQCESLADLTAWFNLQARQHRVDEASHVLPTLQKSGNDYVRETVEKLQQNHDWIESHWNTLEPALAGLASRQNWMDMEDVEQHLIDLFQLYKDHMLLKESITNPAMSSLLNANNRVQIMEDMQQRRARWQQ